MYAVFHKLSRKYAFFSHIWCAWMVKLGRLLTSAVATLGM